MPIDVASPLVASTLPGIQSRLRTAPQPANSFRQALQQQQMQQRMAATANQAAGNQVPGQLSSQQQTQIDAAKIASQADVNMGLKHGLQLGGMRTQPLTPLHPAQKFFPIHHPLAPATAAAAATVQTPATNTP